MKKYTVLLQDPALIHLSYHGTYLWEGKAASSTEAIILAKHEASHVENWVVLFVCHSAREGEVVAKA